MLPHLPWKKGTQFLLKYKGQFKIPLRLNAASSNIIKEKSGERDLVNFPRPVRRETPIETRFALPKTWFDYFYKKTGVTGPYMLFGSVSIYLISKEIVVINHTFQDLAAVLLIYPIFHYLLNDKLFPYLTKEHELFNKELDQPREENMNILKKSIEENNRKIWEAEGIVSYLPKAKRENVHLQMEAFYRALLHETYKSVKLRLDYHVEKQSAERRIAHKNLIDWVLTQVKSSITPQHMNNALKQSIAELKTLAAKA